MRVKQTSLQQEDADSLLQQFQQLSRELLEHICPGRIMYSIQCAAETKAVLARQKSSAPNAILTCMIAERNCFYEFHTNTGTGGVTLCRVSWRTLTLWSFLFIIFLQI